MLSSMLQRTGYELSRTLEWEIEGSVHIFKIQYPVIIRKDRFKCRPQLFHKLTKVYKKLISDGHF